MIHRFTPEEVTTIDNSKRTKCEVVTRVMGYHRPVESFNIGKKQEFAERACYNINEKCCGKCQPLYETYDYEPDCEIC